MKYLILSSKFNVENPKKTVNQIILEMMTDISMLLDGKYTMKMWGRQVYVKYGEDKITYGTKLSGANTRKEFHINNDSRMEYSMQTVSLRLYSQYETEYSPGYYGMKEHDNSVLGFVESINMKDQLRHPESIVKLGSYVRRIMTLEYIRSAISFLLAKEAILNDLQGRIDRLIVMDDEESIAKRDKYSKVYNLVRKTTFH